MTRGRSARRAAVFAGMLLVVDASASTNAPASELDRCLEARGLPRVARVRPPEPEGRAVYALVLESTEGRPTLVSPLAEDGTPLAEVLDRASRPIDAQAPAWRIEPADVAARICTPVRLGQAEIDAERRVVVAAGLNYAAHADEAGGGDVFLFPKPVAPGDPYGLVAAPAGVTLLDYEVELGLVLLADVDLEALPSRETLLARSAFFVANEITDREPIIVHKAVSGPGTGFVDAKGQPGFLPVGPWLVRGTELFEALEACGRDGLELRLEVDEGEGPVVRQQSDTSVMILDPRALLERLGDEIEREGLRTPMPLRRSDPWRYYPLAVADETGRASLPAGSVLLTGTPDGIALQAPSALGVLARGLLRLRGPFEQARREELDRAASGEPGGYLEPGDVVRAAIDGLGAQVIRIGRPGLPLRPSACEPAPSRQASKRDGA